MYIVQMDTLTQHIILYCSPAPLSASLIDDWLDGWDLSPNETKLLQEDLELGSADIFSRL